MRVHGMAAASELLHPWHHPFGGQGRRSDEEPH